MDLYIHVNLLSEEEKRRKLDQEERKRRKDKLDEERQQMLEDQQRLQEERAKQEAAKLLVSLILNPSKNKTALFMGVMHSYKNLRGWLHILLDIVPVLVHILIKVYLTNKGIYGRFIIK